MKRDLIPNWSAKKIEVNATLIGAGPTQVEKFLTYPIEQAIKNIPGIETINSESSYGYMSIRIDIKSDHKEISQLEQSIKDTINNLKSSLPRDIEDIEVYQYKMTKAWFSSYSILNFDEQNLQHQKWFYKLKEKIKNTQGVVDVSDQRRLNNIYIDIDPEKVKKYQLNLDNIYLAIQNSFSIYPIGKIEKGSNDYYVEFTNDEAEVSDIENIILKTTFHQKNILLKDIASVQRKLTDQKNLEFVNGAPAISFTIWKDLGSDTISLKQEIEKIIKEEQKLLPKNIELVLTGDGPSFIERQINALKSNALFGILLVVMTLTIFLGSKTSLLTAFGIPLSYMFTFTILDYMGLKIDLISIVGMLLVLGILVDDAIVVSEQYIQNLENGQTPKNAALNAVMKTWLPITGAVATTIIAFMPLLTAGDGLSEMMMAIPIVVMSALFISLIESFFILPNHLAHFVKKAPKHKKEGLFNILTKFYQRTLVHIIRFRYLAIISITGLFIFSMYFAQKNIPMNFNLNINSEKVRIVTVLKQAKDLEDARKQVKEIWDNLIVDLDKSKYEYIGMSIGSIWEGRENKKGPQYTSLAVRFSQLDDNVEDNKKYIEEELKKRIEKISTTYADRIERIEIARRFDGIDEDKSNIIDVKINSTNPYNIEEITREIKKSLSSIEQISAIDLDSTNLTKSWVFTPNKAEISAHGLSLYSLANQVRAHISQTKLYISKSSEEQVGIYAGFKSSNEHTLKSLSRSEIILENGISTPSSKLGRWMEIEKDVSISHENLKRFSKVSITYKKDETIKEDLIKQIEEKLKEIENTYQFLTITTKDADEEASQNKSSMQKSILLAFGLIFFVLAIVLSSIINPIVICSAIPFGLIGVIWAFYLQGLKLDIMAFIGVIAMAGVVVNDSLLLVDTVTRINPLSRFISKLDIINGASKRLRPILLTSITTLGGVFPMAYGIGGDSGFTKPLAMSMGWGLLFATFITLVIIPCLLLVVNDIKKLFLKDYNLVLQAHSTDNLESEITKVENESIKTEEEIRLQ